MPEIILKNITKRFGKSVAVDNLNLVIKDGDFVSLLGPSGCGKTTTLRMIAGLETPTEGEIYIDGKLVFSSEKGVDVSPDKRNVGFLFQNYALWPHMTVYKNIAFGLENMKWDKEKIRKRVEELLDTLKIREYVDRYPAELSGGQQQRVAIARTLATNPKILLMDEPLSNLDAKLRMEMRTELKRLRQETGSTFVYVTHDQLEAMTLSTKICLMKNGLLQQYSSPLEVYGKPANLFAADFVGNPSINLIHMDAEEKDGHIALSNADMKVQFVPVEDLKIPGHKKVVLGIRPEFLKQTEENCLETSVESSLPSGMETILVTKAGHQRMTSVIFGSVDFKVGTKIHMGFAGNHYLLFDAESGERMGEGQLLCS